jgi:hypothetical protein
MILSVVGGSSIAGQLHVSVHDNEASNGTWQRQQSEP